MYRIGEVRRSKDLTQEQLAAMLGLSVRALQSYEASKTPLRTVILIAIASVLQVTVDDLIDKKAP